MEAGHQPREADLAPDPGTIDPTEPQGRGMWVPADPGPLGLAAFALTTFVLSVLNANLVGKGATPVVFPLMIAYGGVAQFAAGMWEFRTGNTFGAVVFSSFGMFWASLFVLFQFELKSIPVGEANAAVGLFLWAWAIFTLYLTVCALRTTGIIALIFIVLEVTFILLAIGNSGGNASIIHAGGYTGIATAALAWYASFAAIINAVWGRTVLPIFPIGV